VFHRHFVFKGLEGSEGAGEQQRELRRFWVEETEKQ